MLFNDVLSGAIPAFIAQGADPFQAAAAGAYFHGLAGDTAVEEVGEMSLSASHLLEYLPWVMAHAPEEEDEEDL